MPTGSKLERKFQERLDLFIKNKKNPILRDHNLIGKLKSFRAFSITGDVRVIYSEEPKDEIIFIDIGTHSQVYS